MLTKIGRIFATKEVVAKMESDLEFKKFVMDSLKRYANEDWGELGEEDKQINDEAVKKNERLFAAYKKDDYAICIVTESGSIHTTIMMAEEY